MPEALQKTYSGKKVFLTGHTGFKGGWLLKMLHMMGAEIKGYALAPENDTDLYHTLRGDSLCTSIIADIRDRERLINEVVLFEPDFIFHLAAQPLVRLSYEIPAETLMVNAVGTAHLLDAVRALQKPCTVVLITTDKVYHNNEWHYPYRETDRLGGYDLYSASKACAEIVIDSYRASFFNPGDYEKHRKGLAVARAGNVIGGGDFAKDRLVPDIVRAISKGEKVVVRNPAAIRPWQHVLEPLGAYLLLGQKLHVAPKEFSEAYNIGPNHEDTLYVEDLVNIALKHWQSGSYHTPALKDQPHEAGLLKLDISKAVNELGWRPRLHAEKAIELTMAWYQAYFNRDVDMADYTEKQISEYLSI